MKIIAASDIHGSAFWCRKMLEAFDREQGDRLLLLGDLLYHGPRNDLPQEYDPRKVIELLNAGKDRIFCVRGNCDTEVDQMVLEFPIQADYAVILLGNRLVYATHGHKFHKDALPPLRTGDILLYGHTHVPLCTWQEGILCLNPGSVAIPKEGSWHGYMVLTEQELLWKDMEGNVRNRYLFGE